MSEKIKVIILAQREPLAVLVEGLSKAPELTIVNTASNTEDVLNYINRHSKDSSMLSVLVDYDSHFVTPPFFQVLKQNHVPTVAIAESVNQGFKLMEYGASDMVVRRGTEAEALSFYHRMLAVHIVDAMQKIKADKARVSAHSGEPVKGKIIAIGSSTGGTETLLSILKEMPANAPPILVVQHMPPVFTKMYADRVNTVCAVDAWEAHDGDRLANGLVLIAPGDYHMTLEKRGGHFCVSCQKGKKVHNQCPAVDVLFDSVAAVAKADALGVILTGMGADGASGLLKMRKAGAYTIGQDKETSIVYGMPRAAFELGAVDIQLPLEKIPQEILSHVW